MKEIFLPPNDIMVEGKYKDIVVWTVYSYKLEEKIYRYLVKHKVIIIVRWTDFLTRTGLRINRKVTDLSSIL